MTQQVARVYRLYRFYAEDGTLLYVGQTGRFPFRRLLEHVCDKPWAGEMARWEVDPGVWYSEADVLAVEKATIRAEQPAYNVAHNEWNPRRRDPGPSLRPAARPTQSRVGALAWRVLRSRGFWLAAGWLVLAVAGWAGIAHVLPHLPAQYAAGGGVVGATAFLVRATRRRRRRRRRR